MTKKWHGGKGSTAREGSYSKQFKDNWDKIFGKKKERAGLNWELEDEQTHTEKAREDDNQKDLQKVIEQNKDLLHQIKFWQELYLKSISQEK